MPRKWRAEARATSWRRWRLSSVRKRRTAPTGPATTWRPRGAPRSPRGGKRGCRRPLCSPSHSPSSPSGATAPRSPPSRSPRRRTLSGSPWAAPSATPCARASRSSAGACSRPASRSARWPSWAACSSSCSGWWPSWRGRRAPCEVGSRAVCRGRLAASRVRGWSPWRRAERGLLSTSAALGTGGRVRGAPSRAGVGCCALGWCRWRHLAARHAACTRAPWTRAAARMGSRWPCGGRQRLATHPARARPGSAAARTRAVGRTRLHALGSWRRQGSTGSRGARGTSCA
mmetsp:Transcript_3507/g.11704  ORF Transcript_3507/g.11704 Transcript_3507/m.11704 type:complete len:287 (-) Transcript_3507:318-1178(-)